MNEPRKEERKKGRKEVASCSQTCSCRVMLASGNPGFKRCLVRSWDPGSSVMLADLSGAKMAVAKGKEGRKEAVESKEGWLVVCLVV